MEGSNLIQAAIESAQPVKREASPPPPAGETVEHPAPASDADTLKALAGLPPLDYDRKRKDTAKAMGVQVGTLDKLVQGIRDKASAADDAPFPDVAPWPQPVNAAALLHELAATIRRFIVCSPHTANGAALWAAFTWFIDVVEVAPIAVITAPEKRCGKSQLLGLLMRLSRRPITASNISPAALYRAVEQWGPTLLIDEADAFMRDNEDLRGILNSGHTRDAAYVVRVVGEDFKPQRFSTWGAKALSGIGTLPDTIMDRAVKLELRRKLPGENVERLRYAEPSLFETLAAKLARMADDSAEAVRLARPALPTRLNDRAQDNWEPLLAIADMAGEDWPRVGREAALALAGEVEALTGSAELLEDIRSAFDAKNAERLTTAGLIEALCSDDEAPWATYARGNRISPRQLARKLTGYGIQSKNVRVDYTVSKGYERSQFDDAFNRYLAPPAQSATPLQTSNDGPCSVAPAQTAPATAPANALQATDTNPGNNAATPSREGVACSGNGPPVAAAKTASATLKPNNDGLCSGVADTAGETGKGMVRGSL